MNQVATPSVYASRSEVAQPWRQALPALLFVLGWTLFLYRDTGIAMVTIWARSDTFAHAFLVVPIVLWLIWRRRQAVVCETPQPAISMFVLVACAALAWLLGDLAAINALTQLAYVAVLVLAVPAVLGLAVTRQIMFPLGFLFFAVPLGEFLMPQLMEWTATFTVLALRLSGVAVYREGLQFVIPSGNWSVVEACSGVRYLIASLTVGTLFAYLNFQSTQRRVLFVIVSLVVPVIANWLRAYMIVMLGHLSDNKLAAGVDHLIYGWLFFGLVIMLMFFIGARWAEPDQVPAARNAAAPARLQAFNAARLLVATAGFAALVALPHIAVWALERGQGDGPVALSAPAVLDADWQAVPAVEPGFKPAFQNPSAEINRSYASAGRTVGLYLGYYHHQDYSRKLVSSNNVLVVSNDPQWAQVASSTRAVVLGRESVSVRSAELRSAALSTQGDPSRLVAWQFYWINGTVTASDYLAKAYSALYRLLGRGDESAVIIVYSPKDQAGGAPAVLQSFLSTNYAAINALLLKTRPSK